MIGGLKVGIKSILTEPLFNSSEAPHVMALCANLNYRISPLLKLCCMWLEYINLIYTKHLQHLNIPRTAWWIMKMNILHTFTCGEEPVYTVQLYFCEFLKLCYCVHSNTNVCKFCLYIKCIARIKHRSASIKTLVLFL